jgi:hypothetical protein
MRAFRLHKVRYLCKFQVQLCAVVSQISSHRDALTHAHKAANLASGLISEAQLICKEHLRKHCGDSKKSVEKTQDKDSPEAYGGKQIEKHS